MLNQEYQRRDEQFDRELAAFISKTPIPKEPEIPAEITFPFMMVFYRKKPSLRNHNYLMAVAIFSIADLTVCVRSLTHKGWPVMTLIFDLPDFMQDDQKNNRYIYYKFQSWSDIIPILSDSDKMLITDMGEMYPCKIAYMKEKSGQLKFIL